MSASTVEYYIAMTQLVFKILGIPVLITGSIGDIFNLIVFLSLKTFRKNSCAFYLTIMAIADFGQMITGFLSRIMISGFGIDWTLSSLFYCKFRIYCFQFCVLVSLTCMCLATINQFLATCSNPHWQRWSNIKIAQRIIVVLVFISLLHGIPYLICYSQIESLNTGKLSCASSNWMFQQYMVNGFAVVLTGFLPVVITGIFAFLAHHNTKQLDRQALPFIQRELDKQLTAMVFIQFIYRAILTIPYLLTMIFISDTTLSNDTLIAAKLQFANGVTLCLYYLNYAVS
jgi:hypothetical protein